MSDIQREIDKYVIGNASADAINRVVDPDQPPVDDTDPAKPQAANPARRRWQSNASLLILAGLLVAAILVGIWSRLHPLGWAFGVLALFAGALWIDSGAQKLKRRLLARDREIQALKGLQRQYGNAEQMASLGVWSLDLARNQFNWTEGAFRLFSVPISQGEPSVNGFLVLVHAEDQARWREVHKRAGASGREARIEYRYQRPDRSIIWVRSVARAERDESGQVVRLVGTVQDISPMRAMQQQLAASEGKFRELTNMSSDWVWETDAEHRVSFLSDSIDAVLGIWARDALGKQSWTLSGDIGDVDWDAHRAILNAHKPFENFEYSRLDPDGHQFHLSISGRPLFDANGQFVGYRGTGRDITREKQQRTLLRLESEMAQIIREQTDTDRAIALILERVCALMNWNGGAYLSRVADGKRFVVREGAGSEAFRAGLARLAGELAPIANTAEDSAWSLGRAAWVNDFARQPDLGLRWRLPGADVNALFLAPIRDEQQQVMSVMLFASPNAYKASEFLSQVADSLSRTLSLYLQRKAAERRLTHASLHDALTGLPNRVYITHQLEERLKANRPAAVLYVDLDRYKIINDTLGHSVGDQVLIEVARRFRDTIRPIDVAGRIGGDEFILLLSDTADRAEIEGIARQVLAAIERPFILVNRPYFLSASIGVAIAPTDGTDGKVLIKCADAAMYQVKSEGRNDVRFFTGGLSDERTEQLQLASELPLAIQRGEVDLHYQPIFALASRTVVGFEALLRWQHPTRGLLLPDKFLPMAEQSNLIREIGLWAIRRALDDRVQLGLTRFPDVAVSVNVSARQLAEEGFLSTLNTLLAERGIQPKLLRLELTESALIETSDKTIALISDLRRIGVRVIIDNFGTGYASLSYLKNLPVDGLKIDQAFIRNLPADRGNAAIVQAITTLAAKLGFQAMAEGVETTAELKALRSYDCDQMQGTLISEPLPFAQLEEFMQTLPALRQMHLVKDTAGA